jgi:hypothetical protein
VARCSPLLYPARWRGSHNGANRPVRRGDATSETGLSPYHECVGMRTNCKFYESRTYASGESVRKCDLDLAPEAPWRCPENCPAFKPRMADVGWSYGTLQTTLGPARPEELDESAAALLDEAEDIVNAIGPEILAEFKKQDERRGVGAWLGKFKRRR